MGNLPVSKIDSKPTDHLLDASGLICPEPVMLLHKKIREIAEGETLLVIATDPSSNRDIQKFCLFLGHTLFQTIEDGQTFRYYIRKQAG
ncbi:MAG: sulfurtransferase TusA [Pseudohongiellaceae bacterium]